MAALAVDHVNHLRFGSPEDRSAFVAYEPAICPASRYIQRDLDFRTTQISDCAIISSEVSPAGVINLVNHCWKAVIRLLKRGLMCRGYITRGRIFHTDTQVIGSGYQQVYDRERQVSAFKRSADERGTPFVERESNDNMRRTLQTVKERVESFVDTSNPHAVSTAEHYIKALNDQLRICDEIDEAITRLSGPYQSR